MMAKQIHQWFKAQPGSHQVASEFAIHQVMKAVERTQPRRILEVGAGIGTLTVAIFNACLFVDHVPEIYYVEDDPTCLEAMKRNIPPTWYRMLRRFGLSEPPNLVIIDSDQMHGRAISAIMAQRALVVVEGNRRQFRKELESGLDAGYAKLHLKPTDRSKGVWLYQLDATPWERIIFTVRQLWQDTLDLSYTAYCRATGRESRIGKKRREP